MAALGTIALALALAAAVATVVTGFTAGFWRSARFGEISRNGLFVATGLIVIAVMALLHAFLHHDYSISYVHGRSETRMPLAYKMAALWGGQEGSLLLWVTVTATFAAGAAWMNRGRLPAVMPFFHGIIGLILTGFLLILNFVTPPFAEFAVIDIPRDGSGLNPLLQTPLMVIHPPTLLSGFATFAIPFAFGMAALLARQTGADWLIATRRWTLISWMLLSVGNILGGMWAYRELGWGGYWAWDPVENAALIPWFTATAFLHSVVIQEQRGMLKRWNAVLVALTFLLTLLGTWMTRSGLIESVHTFAESEIGNFFLALLLSMTAFSVAVIASRWKLLRSEVDVDTPVSREGAFILNNWLLVTMAFVVLWGTLFPKFKEMLTGDLVSVGPTWFNRNMAPLGLALLGLMAIGTLLPWRRVTLASLRRNFTMPLAVTVVVTPVSVVLYGIFRAAPLGIDTFSYSVALAIVGWAFILFNTATLVGEFGMGVRSRLRKSPGDTLGAVLGLVAKHRRRYGGYLVHLGVVMIFLAFLGNVLKADADVTLRVGQTTELGDYTVRFDGLEQVERTDRVELIATMRLERGGRVIGNLHPARFDFNDYSLVGAGRPDPMKITSEIYIRSSPLEDVYIALLNTDPERNAAAFKLTVLPFTWWFWFGGVVLIAGTLVALWPDESSLSRARARSSAAARFGGSTLLVFVLVGLGATSAPSTARAEEHADTPLEDRRLESRDRERIANEAFQMVMTTCTGCAGKTLSTASPSCYSSNIDRARIREMVGEGADLAAVLDVFVEERGTQALAIPPPGGTNRLIWLVPLLAALGAAGVVVVRVRTWRRDDVPSGSQPAALASASPRGAEPEDPFLRQLREELAASE